jgi:hypothetical protein
MAVLGDPRFEGSRWSLPKSPISVSLAFVSWEDAMAYSRWLREWALGEGGSGMWSGLSTGSLPLRSLGVVCYDALGDKEFLCNRRYREIVGVADDASAWRQK